MLFNSEQYIALILVAVALYWVAPFQRIRMFLMLIASVIFYASWDWRFLLLLYGAIVVTWLLVRSGRARSAIEASPARAFFTIAVILNLLLLAIFKYTDFLIAAFGDVQHLVVNSDAVFQPLGLILPLGISFFTFQLIAYVVDVRRGDLQPERSLLTFSVFLSFFPQLIAGPICRGKELLPQLNELQPFRWSAIVQGLLMLAVGYFIKAGLADNIAPFVETVYSDAAAATPDRALFATVGFALQILFDFWGYSTMALGSAWLFGLMLPTNFNLPYIAASFQSFWRRWHMTLSFWLRDYLYISLGGNRVGAVRTYINLFIVMLLGGLWHGASYVFVIWGAIHGGALAVERLMSKLIGSGAKSRALSLALSPARWLLTMAIVLVAWVFFRASSFGDALTIIGKMGEAVAHIGGTLDAASDGDQEMSAAIWFMALGILAMYPLHLLNIAGNNQNFYDRNAVWRSDEVDTRGVEHSVPVAPVDRISLGRRQLPLPTSVKLIAAFWLFVGGYILSSGDTVPFIYFQF